MLSYDGSVIAIGAPGATKIAAYSLADSTSTLKDVIHGYNPAISSGGEFIGTASAKSGSSQQKRTDASDQCNIDLFGRKHDNFQPLFTYAFSCDLISEGIAITHSDDRHIWLDTKDQSYNVCGCSSSVHIVSISQEKSS